MQLLKHIEEYLSHILLIIGCTIVSMIIYSMSSDEEPKKRKKSTITGGLISVCLSYGTWAGIGHFFSSTGQIAVFWMPFICFAYTVSGQFIPEMLQSLWPKLVKFLYRSRTGEDLDK